MSTSIHPHVQTPIISQKLHSCIKWSINFRLIWVTNNLAIKVMQTILTCTVPIHHYQHHTISPTLLFHDDLVLRWSYGAECHAWRRLTSNRKPWNVRMTIRTWSSQSGNSMQLWWGCHWIECNESVQVTAHQVRTDWKSTFPAQTLRLFHPRIVCRWSLDLNWINKKDFRYHHWHKAHAVGFCRFSRWWRP